MTLRRRTCRLGLAVVVAATVAALIVVPAAGAKKKGGGKKGGGTVDITKAANGAIPDANPPFGSGNFGIVNSTIEVGKQFRGRQIRDVNVTLTTTGTAGKTAPPSFAPFVGPIQAFDLIAILRAPNGAHTRLFSNLTPPLASNPPVVFAPFPSLGPLTLDDESPFALGVINPHDPFEIYAPYIGTARPGGKALAIMDNGPVTGTWTLSVLDILTSGTSNLTSWSIDVTAGRPYLTK